MGILKIVAALMALYGLYGIYVGKVYAKDKWSARYVYKADEPIAYWITCLAYVGVGTFIYFFIDSGAINNSS
ncbi:MAG: hypothetical protein HWE27_11860 [Gammaproteobacteria bacterium]|nr:hypothetical protein [Gammaproteobacteria bacterium]